MDYKYIEQLVERYFNCETSLQEEQILRSFFQQEEIPAGLLRYRDLFRYEEQQAMSEELGDDFDARILSIVEQPVVKAKRIPFVSYVHPFFKAAAAVAIFLTVGNAVQHSFYDEGTSDFQQGKAQPEMGYQQPNTPLQMTAEEFKTPVQEDSSIDTLAVLTSPAEGQ